jgi:hypothetical protein
MGPRNAEETAAFGLITRSVMNTLWKLFSGRPLAGRLAARVCPVLPHMEAGRKRPR